MSTGSGTLSGRCLCGAVMIEVEGEHATAVGVCHCGMCRRWGDGVYADLRAEARAVTVTGRVTRYASSDFAERAFCATCGSHLWFRATDLPEPHYSLMPGLFPEAAGFGLAEEIYVDRASAYAALAGDHERLTRAEHEARSPHVEGN